MSTHGGEQESMEPDGGHETDAVARYRRVLAVLPRAYREEHGEEMLGVMLDAAEDSGRVRPTLGEALSVLGLSLRLRTGAPGASARSRSVGEALRLITLLGLLLQAGAFAQNVASAVNTDIAGYGPLAGMTGLTPGPAGVAVLGFLCPFAALFALLGGRYRLGVLLAANPVVLVTEVPRLFATASNLAIALGNVITVLALCVLPAVAGVLGFHRAAPRVAWPRRWIGGMILLAAVFGELDYANGRLFGSAWALASNALAVGCALLAVGIALSRVRRGAVWPTAFMVVGAPLLCMLPYSASSLSSNGWLINVPTVPGSMYFYVGLYALGAEVLLAAVLAVILLRRLRTRAASSA